MNIKERYERNIPAITAAQQEELFSKKVLILGCGGLGGYILESLARIGVGQITAVDGDVFEANNLNRQLYSAPHLLGQKKISAAALRIQSIAPEILFIPVREYFSKTNADKLICGQDLVMDALDNLKARLLMEDTCQKHGIPFVHGAILGWNLQVITGYPGQHVLHRLYETTDPTDNSNASCKTSLPMTASACAAIQTAEAIKILTGQPASLNEKLLFWNLQTMEQNIISFSNSNRRP